MPEDAPYDPYIPAGQSGASQGQGNARTQALQAVSLRWIPSACDCRDVSMPPARLPLAATPCTTSISVVLPPGTMTQEVATTPGRQSPIRSESYGGSKAIRLIDITEIEEETAH